jgi:hypothetical protein
MVVERLPVMVVEPPFVMVVEPPSVMVVGPPPVMVAEPPPVMVGAGPPSTACAKHGTDLGGASPLRAGLPEPLAQGNCVTARWGGEEAGGKTRS